MNIRRYDILLLIILALSGILRLQGIDFGLPELLHPDEPFEINRALRLAAGSFDWERTDKGGLFFILLFEMGVAFVLLYIGGVVSGPFQFAEWFARNEHLFYLSGRVTCALLSAGSVLLVYLLGKKIVGKSAGMYAALLMAISPLAIEKAHFSVVDNLLVFVMLCSWLLLFKALENDRTKYWLGAGLFAGFSIITKLPGILMMIPIGLALLMVPKKTFRGRLALGGFVFAVFIMVALVGQPGLFLNLEERVTGYMQIYIPQGVEAPGDTPAFEASWEDQRGIHPGSVYLQTMLNNTGWPVLLIALASFIWLSFRRNRNIWLIGSFLIPYLLLISLTQTNLVYGRYLLPALPLVYLLCVSGLFEFKERIAGTLPNSRIILLFVLLLLILPILPESWSSSRKFSLPNTRILAQQWIHANVPAESTVLLEGGREHRSQYMVPLYNLDSNIGFMIDEIRERDTGKAEYWMLKREALADIAVPRYDLWMVMRHDAWPDLSQVMRNGVDYVVIDTNQFHTNDIDQLGQALKSRIQFYNEMKAHSKVHLIASIPHANDNWGPGMEIYRLDREEPEG